MDPSPANQLVDTGERAAGAVTSRLRRLEGLLARTGEPAAPRLIIVCERLVAVVGALGLIGTLGLGARASFINGASLGWVGWCLLSLAAGLLAAGTILAAGAGRWDALVMRLRRRPQAAIPLRDRWTTLIAAILLITSATVELACFQALVDGRADAQAQAAEAAP